MLSLGRGGMTQSRPAQGLQMRTSLSIAAQQSEGTYAGCNADVTRISSDFECLRIFRNGSYAMRSTVTEISTIAFYL